MKSSSQAVSVCRGLSKQLLSALLALSFVPLLSNASLTERAAIRDQMKTLMESQSAEKINLLRLFGQYCTVPRGGADNDQAENDEDFLLQLFKYLREGFQLHFIDRKVWRDWSHQMGQELDFHSTENQDWLIQLAKNSEGKPKLQKAILWSLKWRESLSQSEKATLIWLAPRTGGNLEIIKEVLSLIRRHYFYSSDDMRSPQWLSDLLNSYPRVAIRNEMETILTVSLFAGSNYSHKVAKQHLVRLLGSYGSPRRDDHGQVENDQAFFLNLFHYFNEEPRLYYCHSIEYQDWLIQLAKNSEGKTELQKEILRLLEGRDSLSQSEKATLQWLAARTGGNLEIIELLENF